MEVYRQNKTYETEVFAFTVPRERFFKCINYKIYDIFLASNYIMLEKVCIFLCSKFTTWSSVLKLMTFSKRNGLKRVQMLYDDCIIDEKSKKFFFQCVFFFFKERYNTTILSPWPNTDNTSVLSGITKKICSTF